MHANPPRAVLLKMPRRLITALGETTTQPEAASQADPTLQAFVGSHSCPPSSPNLQFFALAHCFLPWCLRPRRCSLLAQFLILGPVDTGPGYSQVQEAALCSGTVSSMLGSAPSDARSATSFHRAQQIATKLPSAKFPVGLHGRASDVGIV